MHPALSVIFFTTLSGAGFGLLLWLGISILLLHANGSTMQSLHMLQVWTLILGLALSTVGLLSSLAHLGKPQRAWRALSQWRTSWLSREGVLALATMLPAIAMGGLLLFVEPGADRAVMLGASGLLLAVLSLATVACTAMIYASLPPIPAWRHPLVLPVYILFAIVTGLALLFVLMAILLPVGRDARAMLVILSVLSVLVVAAKWLYWHGIDRSPCRPAKARRSACRIARSACSNGRTPSRTSSPARWPSWSPGGTRPACDGPRPGCSPARRCWHWPCCRQASSARRRACRSRPPASSPVPSSSAGCSSPRHGTSSRSITEPAARTTPHSGPGGRGFAALRHNPS
ncbi:MAG: dimethyl sulfoxide reductase anchor subunit [Luteimonas sp.]|nr:dimethyl sulfoxide reductase anchor subunit [Luteimonas sp.]